LNKIQLSRSKGCTSEFTRFRKPTSTPQEIIYDLPQNERVAVTEDLQRRKPRIGPAFFIVNEDRLVESLALKIGVSREMSGSRGRAGETENLGGQ